MTKFSSDIIVIIDCQTAGISGDMILGALLDIGADLDKVTHAIKSLESPKYGYSNIKIDINQTLTNGFQATKATITLNNKQTQKNGTQLIKIIENATQNLNISNRAKQFASNVIHSLVNTEAKIHGNTLPNVHLHEIGLIDTAAEIIGTAVALDDLNLFDAKIFTTPISIGGGLFKFSHGTTSSPSPATLALLQSKNFSIKGGPVESELTTPTGAAILINLAHEATNFYPEITLTKTGYGTGDKTFSEIPNILRIIIGKTPQSNNINNDYTNDDGQITILETNLDDTTGEIIGYTIDRLLTEGAKDVFIIPAFTKKNRPAQIIKVIADQKDTYHLTKVLIEETGTLGVRIHYCKRYVTPRGIYPIELTLNNQKENIKIKYTKNHQGKITHIKPEYEDLKHIAKKTGIPLREISNIAITKAQNLLQTRKTTNENTKPKT
ncbi:MAG: nickel pincer cofactor biosynthesis protein LarC [Nitrososphaerota archaeon]|jgi:uncharacterized protein (TIGR00299 family) protein|nr:nickel pincer cofactor biosynthesis protein LarC [Nitrososphaerota archaeon]